MSEKQVLLIAGAVSIALYIVASLLSLRASRMNQRSVEHTTAQVRS